MKKSVNDKIDYIHSLARLNEDSNDNKEILDEIDKVMSYFDILDEVDTADVRPMYQFEEESFFLREDIVKKSNKIQGVHFNEEGYVVVPKGEGV